MYNTHMIKFPNVEIADTAIAVDLRFHVPKAITEAKEYLNKNYNNPLTLEPHITIVICPCPKRNLEKCFSDLLAECQKQTDIQFQLEKMKFNSEDLLFFLPIISSDFTDFHKKMLNIANKYRENALRTKDKERFSKTGIDGYSEEEKKIVIKYGNRNAGENFDPHISIGKIRVKNYNIQEITEELNSRISDFEGKILKIEKIHLVAYVDAVSQSSVKPLKEIYLDLLTSLG